MNMQTHHSITQGLNRLCKQGTLESLKAYDNETSFTTNYAHSRYAFELACKFGHLNVVEWLINKPDIDSNVRLMWGQGFYEACQYGHLDIIQYILYSRRLFIHEGQVRSGLDTASTHKQPRVFRYLLSVCPQLKHHSACNLFKWTCINGSQECAEILLDMYPDIDITHNSHEAFKSSCKQLDVARWLQSLKPWLYKVNIIQPNFRDIYSDYDSDIEFDADLLEKFAKKHNVPAKTFIEPQFDLHINTPQEQAFYFKKYPLWLMSPNSPNKKSIFYRLPEAISKMIIKEWL
jgi:hypothetical protein